MATTKNHAKQEAERIVKPYAVALILLLAGLIGISCSQNTDSDPISAPTPSSIDELVDVYCESSVINQGSGGVLRDYCHDLEFLSQKLLSVRTYQPTVVTVSVDQSASMEGARTAPPELKHFYPLLDVLQAQGGSIAVNTICVDSNKPSVRAMFYQVSPLDLDKVRIDGLPIPPDITSGGSPFQKKRELEAYREEIEKMKTQIDLARQSISSYLEEFQNLPTINSQNREQVLQQIESILERSRDCRATDIQNAIKRSNIILSEENIFQQEPKTYSVFITDGLDSFPVDSSNPIKSQADVVILVNGNSANLGIFEGNDYPRFDAPQPAFDYLIKQVKQ